MKKLYVSVLLMLIIYSFFGMLLEKGQKGGHCMMCNANSPAHDSSDHAVEARSITVDVGGYRVKAANAPILTFIITRYGDIAANCMFTSATVRASMLEVICDIVKRLLSSNAVETISQLEAMKTELRDAEAARIEPVAGFQSYRKGFGSSSKVGHGVRKLLESISCGREEVLR
ncbi:hypothetical protein ACET3Z_026751 [Daucus carota]